jgi:TRAP-type C4-dicarboxylate transport system permease small subunit
MTMISLSRFTRQALFCKDHVPNYSEILHKVCESDRAVVVGLLRCPIASCRRSECRGDNHPVLSGLFIPFSMELAVFLSSCMYFVAYAVLLKRDEDVRMQYFFDRLGPKAQVLIDTVTDALIVAFFALILIKAIEFYRMTSMMMHPLFPIKQSYSVLPVLLGGAICLWVALYRFWAGLDALARKRDKGKS